MYLLFPVLEFFDEEVVTFCDLGDFTIHTSLEMNVILPCFIDFPCECVLLANHLVQVSHTDFGHDGLFLVSLEDGCHASVAAGFFADVVDDVHDGILIPPFWVLDTLDLSTHDLMLEWNGRGSTMIGPEGWSLPSG